MGRVEGVANDHSIHEAYSLVFGAGTRPRSMRSGIANLNDALLDIVHQRNTEQSASITGTTFCHLSAILHQASVTRKIRRRGNGRFIAASKLKE